MERVSVHFSPVFTATSDDVVHTASKRKLHDNLLLRSVVENHAGSGTELTPALAAGGCGNIFMHSENSHVA